MHFYLHEVLNLDQTSKRDIIYKYLMNDVKDGIKSSIELFNVLRKHYPDNIEKQKDLLCALYDAFKGMTTKETSLNELYKAFRKWEVREVLWSHILIFARNSELK